MFDRDNSTKLARLADWYSANSHLCLERDDKSLQGVESKKHEMFLHLADCYRDQVLACGDTDTENGVYSMREDDDDNVEFAHLPLAW